MAFCIFLVSLFCGAYAVISQAYLAREFLVVFLGNEMSLAMLLAGWLAGVAAGARIARAKPLSRAVPVFLFAVALLSWVVLFPLSVTLVRVSREVLGVAPGLYAPLGKLLFAALLFVGPFSAVGGFTFVLLCRVAESAGTRLGPVGLVYIAEAVGGVGGGVLFTFALAGRHGPFEVGFAAYPLMAAALLATLWAGRGGAIRRLLTPVTMGAVFIGAAGATLWATGRGVTLDRNTHVARMMTIAEGVVMSSRESRYENVTALLHSGQYTVFGNGEPLATFPEPVLNEREAYFALAEQGDPKDVLVIGGGPDFLQSVLAYGVRSIDYVELDPAVVEVSKPFLTEASRNAVDSPVVHAYYGDAREFVRQAPKNRRAYDVIFLRVPEPSTLLLDRLYTVNFLMRVRLCLSERGVVAVPVTLADSYLGGDVGRYAGDIYQTMKLVFPHVLVTPDVNSSFLAAKRKGVLTASPEELAVRFTSRDVHSSLFPELFHVILPAERTKEVNTTLAHLPRLTVNTDWHPTTYAANLALWARYSDSTVAGWLLAVTRRPPWEVFGALVIAALVIVGGFARRKVPARAPVIAIFFTGTAAMAVTVMLIYAFQVMCGYVYDWIGVITGAFVAGAAVGGLAGARSGSWRRLVAAEAIVLATPLVATFALASSAGMSANAARWLVLALAAVAGFTTGFEFPVAASVLAAGGSPAWQAGSRIEAADHLGACLGAALTGVIIVPALGFWWSLAMVAVWKALTAIAVVRSRPRAPSL